MAESLERYIVRTRQLNSLEATAAGANVVSGTDLAEALFGTEGEDWIEALGGNDYVFAGDGNDEVLGGSGDDSIYGEAGNDIVSGDDGSDNLDGGSGDDLLLGGAGADVIAGGIGHDDLDGGGDTDILFGDDGNDRLTGGLAGDVLFGGVGNDVLHAGDGNDALYGEGDDDTLNADAGDDVLDGGAGDDTLRGGAGLDLLVGGDGSDTLYGDDESDTLFGESGDDTLTGGAADDALFGGIGADTLSGNDGDDLLYGQEDDDALYGDAGEDALDGGIGSDVLVGGPDDDVLAGGEGSDGLFGEAGADILFGGPGTDHLEGGEGDDSLQGGEGNDVLLGGLGADELSAGADDDSLDGGGGEDQVFAGPGNDILAYASTPEPGRAFYDGGAGIDILRLALTEAQVQDRALQAEIDDLAGFVSRHVDSSSDYGILYSFGNIDLDVRNIEQIEVNGVPRIAERAKIYIDPTAPEGGNGSLARPFNSWHDVAWMSGTDYLQRAGTTIVDSFTVSIQADAEAPVLLGSYGGRTDGGPIERPVVQGAITFDGAKYVTMNGLHVTQAVDAAINIVNGSDHVAVVNNEVSHSGGGVWIAQDAGVANRVEANVIHNNAHHGVAITLAGGAPGLETVVARNSILYNGEHGVEVNANYVIVEQNEVGYNGSAAIGTSGIHVYSSSADEDAAHHNIIRSNVVFGSYENFGPDGCGIELDHWTKFTDVYDNVLFQNAGTGLVAFRASDFRFFDNIVFDNMQSAAHNNFARPTEMFIGSFSLEAEDQVHDYIVYGNTIASGGTFSGSGNENITSVMIDAPTIFQPRNIGNNTYYNPDDGKFYLWGFSPEELWGPGESGTDIEGWNALKQNGDPDKLGGVNLLNGSVLIGDERIDLMVGTDNDDHLFGADGEDVLVGRDGNDHLDGGTGADHMIGGRGDDVYVVADSIDQVWEYPDSGTDTVFASISYALPAFLENALLQDDESLGLVGNDQVNILQGNDAANAIQGAGGGDVLFGHGGDDNLLGDDGDDYLDGGAGDDVLQGGQGHDLLVGGEGEDVFIFNQGEEMGDVLDYEGWLELRGDQLQFNGYGTDASISYTGGDSGVFRIDYVLDGVEMVDHLTLVGVVALSPIGDYVFL